MTTNKEALQKIFEAALKEPELQPAPTTRMRPVAATQHYSQSRKSYGEPVATTTPHRAAKTVSNEASTPNVPPGNLRQEEPATTPEIHAQTAKASSNDIAAAGLASLSNQNAAKDKDQRKTQRLLMSIAIIVAGSIGGGTLWLIQPPKQQAPIGNIITEVQAATETQSIAADGEQPLDEAIALTQQADQAISVTNISSELAADENVGAISPVPTVSESPAD